MPVYLIVERGAEPERLLVEAKSERAARLHMTRHITCEPVGASEMAGLVREGVLVECAATEPTPDKAGEAQQAGERG